MNAAPRFHLPEMPPKPTHGGKRANAGRKPHPETRRKPVSTKIHPELLPKWKALKQKGRWLDGKLRKMKERG